MNGTALLRQPVDTAYWHDRVRAETRAALACDDPRIAAIHVELATRCLRMACAGMPAEVSAEAMTAAVAATPA